MLDEPSHPHKIDDDPSIVTSRHREVVDARNRRLLQRHPTSTSSSITLPPRSVTR